MAISSIRLLLLQKHLLFSLIDIDGILVSLQLATVLLFPYHKIRSYYLALTECTTYFGNDIGLD